MLNEEKKALIEAEERYRHKFSQKLREELSEFADGAQRLENTVWGKVSEFLNSNLGMWLLSSVLVTGGAGLYQTLEHHYEIKSQNRAQLVTRQFEIGNRLQNMKYFLSKAKTVGDAEFALKSLFLSKTPVHPDVEKLSLSVLYFNLYQIEGPHNKEVLELVRKLEDQYYILGTQQATDPLTDEKKAKLLGWVDALVKIQMEEAQAK